MSRFTDLAGCRLPLQQAPMGGVASGPDLAAAVSAAGGLGMVAATQGSASALDAVLDAVAARTDAPFGVNFLMPFVNRELVAIAAARVRVVDFFYGDPDPALVALVHAGGALAGWQVGSAAEARAAVDAGCDLVVAQGVEAGGHVRGRLGLMPLLGEVLAAVDVPVVAAGGIATRESVEGALAAGAGAVRVGTRFIAAEEADAHPDYVAAILAAAGDDTVLTEAFSTGWPDAPHRVLRSCVDAATALEAGIAGETVHGGVPFPVPRWAPPPPGRSTTGHIAAMALYAGQGVGAVRTVAPAAAIVAELAGGAVSAR
ncbi:MAG TPA: nitronate monooxygenase [Candidatus Dormibacteraeota bacterium]|nr:nitronate monooxygenase [Candidatus Dormibacteraeota bacterium]